MNLDFLTPELFNTLIIANIAVGLLLAGTRFYRDMTRPLPNEQRSQVYNESSQSATDDTQPGRNTMDDAEAKQLGNSN